ncbi:MAG: LysR substrate-binding domain-containing protein [Rhodopila sp.]|nr:LysR substrate-binding domain-containing protein [Rhodopila sp.]
MRKLPPLGALRAFEAAARRLSFKAAADELGVSPTAISHQIRHLEACCGRALFRRRPRPLLLTAHGERLYPVLKEGFDRFAAALAGLGTEAEQPLRVTTTNAFAHRWLVPRLKLWRESHPNVALDVIGTDAVCDLHAGEADIAIRYQFAPPAGLATHELFRDTFWPICTPELLRATPIGMPADLAGHTLVHMGWGQSSEPHAPTWRRWLDAARTLDPATPASASMGTLRFREELHAIEAVIAGQGIGILSDVLVARELANGALVKALDLPLPGFGFYLAHVPDHSRHAVVNAFQAWVCSVA